MSERELEAKICQGLKITHRKISEIKKLKVVENRKSSKSGDFFLCLSP